MTTVSATYARDNFAEMIDAAQREPVRIKRHDRELAVLISAEEYEQLREQRWAEFNRLAARASGQAQKNKLTKDVLAEILSER